MFEKESTKREQTSEVSKEDSLRKRLEEINSQMKSIKKIYGVLTKNNIPSQIVQKFKSLQIEKITITAALNELQ